MNHVSHSIKSCQLKRNISRKNYGDSQLIFSSNSGSIFLNGRVRVAIWNRICNQEDNYDVIKDLFMAPAIRGSWLVTSGFVLVNHSTKSHYSADRAFFFSLLVVNLRWIIFRVFFVLPSIHSQAIRILNRFANHISS